MYHFNLLNVLLTLLDSVWALHYYIHFRSDRGSFSISVVQIPHDKNVFIYTRASFVKFHYQLQHPFWFLALKLKNGLRWCEQRFWCELYIQLDIINSALLGMILIILTFCRFKIVLLDRCRIILSTTLFPAGTFISF